MDTMSAAEVSRIVKAAARRASPRLEVVGVTVNKGGSGYVEVLVDIDGCRAEPCQVVLGVFRDVSEAALESTVTEQLRKHVAAHSAAG